MRITSGYLRNRKFPMPLPNKVRPATDKTREAVFSSLGSIIDLEGLEVLDLFSGCGSYTAEAISRGASRVLSIDISPDSLIYQAKAYKSFGIEEKVTIKKADAIRFVRKPGAFNSVDLVFADPPFGLGLEDKFVEALCQINPDTNTLFVLEHRPALSLKKYESVKILKENTFGNSAYSIFQLTQKKT